MDKDWRSTFWHTSNGQRLEINILHTSNGQRLEINVLAHKVLQGVVVGDLHLFYFLFPSCQIACVDLVSPFDDK